MTPFEEDAPLTEWSLTELEDESQLLKEEKEAIQAQLTARKAQAESSGREDTQALHDWRDWRVKAITALRYKEKGIAEIKLEIKRRNLIVEVPPGMPLSDDPIVLLTHVFHTFREIAKRVTISSHEEAVLDYTRAYLRNRG